jgi:LPXTG-motif cell wall-anchored protein
MDQTTTIYIVAGLLIVLLVIAVLISLRRRKTRQLQSRFGTEYDHAVEAAGGRGKAEADLREREKRIDKLDIRPLTETEREFYLTAWDKLQAQFVDDPAACVTQADQLLGVVMTTRGYPVADFDQRAGDVSVEYPDVVEHYRAAHAIALLQARNDATTEEQRQAMIHYRTLFDELVGLPAIARVKLAS